jgi:cobyrinic acid a,c-diamide synthase
MTEWRKKMNLLSTLGIEPITGLDENACAQAEKNWNNIAKPLHGLGKFEDLIVQIAGINKSANVTLNKRAVIAMCADNGIVEEGVTQTDQSVTAIVSCNMADGISSVCKMAACVNAEVFPVNIGIADKFLPTGESVLEYPGLIQENIMHGTKNFLKEPAMSEEQAILAVKTGIKCVSDLKEKGFDIIATGEMGIGNTTTSTALASILLDLEAEKITGRGAGLDDAGLLKKIEVVKKARELYGNEKDNPLGLLQKIGGLDIAGLVGVFLGGAANRVPIIADGVISLVAALIAVKLEPKVCDFLIVSHQGKEPSMPALLNALGKEAVIHGNLALGEGTGAVMLLPLLDMTLKVYSDNVTFGEINVEAYKEM